MLDFGKHVDCLLGRVKGHSFVLVILKAIGAIEVTVVGYYKGRFHGFLVYLFQFFDVI